MCATLAGFSAHGKMRAVETDVPAHRENYDLLVVGGGVNGTGIARDAAGRGFSVLLCEQHDLASHTSSASTKLIHGGLRYLEGFHFALVRKALEEREVLLAAAPHIMWPLRFVMPHDAHLRPMWMIRAGLFLYDHLAKRRRLAASAPLESAHSSGGRSAAIAVSARLHLFGRLDGRCAAGRAECTRRGRPRRGHPHPHPLRPG